MEAKAEEDLPRLKHDFNVGAWVNTILDREMDATINASVNRYSGGEEETRDLFAEIQERLATQAALSKPSLVALLRSNEPLTIAQRTAIADLLEKPKRGRGRPKQPLSQRVRNSFIHYAAADVDRIKEHLDRNFAPMKGRHALAVEIAARRWQFRPQTLENYLKSPRRIRLPAP
jgi:hypothetical protein